MSAVTRQFGISYAGLKTECKPVCGRFKIRQRPFSRCGLLIGRNAVKNRRWPENAAWFTLA
jgi:hypothetical protein